MEFWSAVAADNIVVAAVVLAVDGSSTAAAADDDIGGGHADRIAVLWLFAKTWSPATGRAIFALVLAPSTSVVIDGYHYWIYLENSGTGSTAVVLE
jgi:hypothetical protein